MCLYFHISLRNLFTNLLIVEDEAELKYLEEASIVNHKSSSLGHMLGPTSILHHLLMARFLLSLKLIPFMLWAKI